MSRALPLKPFSLSHPLIYELDIGVGAGGGDRGIGPPLSGLGIIPTFCCNIGKKYQNLLRIA